MARQNRLRAGPIDAANAVEWDHSDNAGLFLWLASPAGTGGGAGGVLRDLTGKTPGGTLLNGAAWGASPGGSGILMVGASAPIGQSVTIPNDGRFSTIRGALTVSASFNMLGVGGGNGRIVTQNDGGTNGWVLNSGSNTQWQIAGGTTATLGYVLTGLGPQRLCGTWDGAFVRLYLNGVLKVATAAANTPAFNTASVIVGNRPAGDRTFQGTIWDVRFSGVCRDAGWVARDYEWSQDPSRDPRLRKASTRSFFVTAGGVPAFSFVPAFAPGWGW